MTMRTQQLKIYGCSKNSSNREVYSNIILPQEQEKQEIDNLTLNLKDLEKNSKNPKVSKRKKKIIKVWAEINEKKIVKINKTKRWFFENINKFDNALARLIK